MTAAPSHSSQRVGGRGALWDPDFGAGSRFDALRGALDALGRHASFPAPELIDEALGALAGIRFVRQPKVPRRRRRTPKDPASMYDARIVNEGVVPTREGSWHDLMNALVWATFPRAKLALHTRQHGLVRIARPGESLRRPRELDALALLDEGGVAVPASGAREPVVFGHAIYEGYVLGWPAPVAAAFPVEGDSLDEAIAGVVAALRDPRELRRLGVEPGIGADP
ncbi:MAG: DUF3025 domain-containing protein [Deltaproteobacteria bacterium]|nr:DUF3025 domain-containing protein [Deltaproteobacteria bacterium]